MTETSLREPIDCVDPDIFAYYADGGKIPSFDLKAEREFKKFIETGWLDPQYDDLRERWDPLILSDNPQGRVMAKTALWSLVKLREIQNRIKNRSTGEVI